MQKNIVFGVNAAMAREDKTPKEATVSGVRSEEFLALRDDIASLKEENTLFAAAVEEMKAQNEELKNKIEELISNVSAKAKPTKKKKGKQKQTARKQ